MLKPSCGGVNISTPNPVKCDIEYTEIIDSNLFLNESHKSIRSIDSEIWVLRIAALVIAFLMIYLVFIDYPDLDILPILCIIFFGFLLVLIDSEIGLQVMKKSATPITIRSDKLWIRPSSIERLRGWEGNIDINDISMVKIMNYGKPHAPYGGTFFLFKMTSRSCEIQIILQNGGSRYSGSKSRETVNQVTKILSECYKIKIDK
jgi:hypothetical protein